MRTNQMDTTDVQALDVAISVLAETPGVEVVARHQGRELSELLSSAARRTLYYSTRSQRWGINLAALEDVQAGLAFEAGVLARV